MLVDDGALRCELQTQETLQHRMETQSGGFSGEVMLELSSSACARGNKAKGERGMREVKELERKTIQDPGAGRRMASGARERPEWLEPRGWGHHGESSDQEGPYAHTGLHELAI